VEVEDIFIFFVKKVERGLVDGIQATEEEIMLLNLIPLEKKYRPPKLKSEKIYRELKFRYERRKEKELAGLVKR